MIATALLFLIHAFLWAITYPIRLLSDATLPSGIQNALDTASGYLTGINAVIPVDTLLALFYTIGLVEAGILAYKGVMWIIRKIPGIN